MFRRRYDLPLGRDGSARLVPWIVALMSYLAALTLAGALALGVLAWRWTEGVSGALSVLLPPAAEDGAPGPSPARLEQARAALAGLSGVARVEALEAAEVARRLEPWLGSGVSAGDLPLPRLLVVRLQPGAPPHHAAKRRANREIAPGAVVDHNSVWKGVIARHAPP
ncbi:MAG: cell division protein FtsX, partial [Rhodospirillales bacterium]